LIKAVIFVAVLDLVGRTRGHSHSGKRAADTDNEPTPRIVAAD